MFISGLIFDQFTHMIDSSLLRYSVIWVLMKVLPKVNQIYLLSERLGQQSDSFGLCLSFSQNSIRFTCTG